MIKPDISKLYRTQLSEKYFKNKYSEYVDFLKCKYPGLTWQDKLYCDQHNLNEPPKCPTCGKQTKLISLFKGYAIHCCKQCAYKDPERQQKIQNTTYHRYGVRHALQSEKIYEKFEQTCLERYGVDSPTKNQEILQKALDTTISKYGALGSASEIIKQKVSLSRRKNRLKNQIIPNQIGYTEHGLWIMKCTDKSKCSECDGMYEIDSGTYYDRIQAGNVICTKLNPISHCKIQNTSIERFVKIFLDKNNIEYETNNRTILKGKEIDIYIPSMKIGIECNGVYWHSDKYKSKTYHIDKHKTCEERGVQLIQLWSDWVFNKPEIVKSLLKSKLGICNNTIYARKCILKEVNPKEANKFLEENHIQGKCNSSVKLGLYCGSKLVSLMCFDKKHQLVRFCNLRDSRVVGGASKLLKYYIETYKPNTIISYSSNDISNGHLYEKLGFKPSGTIQTAYWYISPDMKRYHRTTFSRQGINSKWPEYKLEDHSWTEKSVMDSKGYNRIYDSGLICWILKREDQ